MKEVTIRVAGKVYVVEIADAPTVGDLTYFQQEKEMADTQDPKAKMYNMRLGWLEYGEYAAACEQMIEAIKEQMEVNTA